MTRAISRKYFNHFSLIYNSKIKCNPCAQKFTHSWSTNDTRTHTTNKQKQKKPSTTASGDQSKMCNQGASLNHENRMLAMLRPAWQAQLNNCLPTLALQFTFGIYFFVIVVTTLPSETSVSSAKYRGKTSKHTTAAINHYRCQEWK